MNSNQLIKNFIRENLKDNKFNAKDLTNAKQVMLIIDDCEEVIIKGDIQNICNAIIGLSVHNMRFNGATCDLQFILNDEYFMNTIGMYLDLCANLEYLEEVKKILIPMQLEVEKHLYEGTLDKLPEYKFVILDENSDESFTWSSYEAAKQMQED